MTGSATHEKASSSTSAPEESKEPSGSNEGIEDEPEVEYLEMVPMLRDAIARSDLLRTLPVTIFEDEAAEKAVALFHVLDAQDAE